MGKNKVTSLLILSQVILSFSCHLAVIGYQFTGDSNQDGREFLNSRFTVVVPGTPRLPPHLFFNGPELVWPHPPSK